jgi:hypothetical protein
VKCVKILNNYRITNGLFERCSLYMIINNLTNNHFQMEDDKKCENGRLLKFHFKCFLDV